MVGEHISARAGGYGIASASIDGNDVEAVFVAASAAAAQVRDTQRPFLLETMTYRLRGHYEPDDQSYVDPEELAHWCTRDPIALYAQRLAARGMLDAACDADLRARVEGRIATAAAFACASPLPALAELTTDVYA